MDSIPLAPPPREARLRSHVRVGAAVIATLVVVVAALLFWLAMQHGLALERLRDGGVLTTGTVESLEVRSAGRSKSRRIAYRFEHDGRLDHGSASVSTTIFERFKIGDPIPVTFERADPTNHQLFEVGEPEVARYRTTATVVGATYFLVALAAAACAAAIYRRRLALLRDGRLVAATVVKVGKFSRKRDSLRVELSVPTPSGVVLTRYHRFKKGALGPEHQGRTIDYLVDSDHENRGEPVVIVLGSCEVV